MSARMTRRAQGLAMLATALASVVFWGAAPAHAYVRSRSDGCTALYWPRTTVQVTPSSEMTADLPAQLTLTLMQDCLTAWQSETTTAFLKLTLGPADEVRQVQFDGIPIIKFDTKVWGLTDSSGDTTFYDQSAVGLTTVFFVNTPSDKTTDGQIVDADIALNNVNDRFYDAPNTPANDGTGRLLADLRNTLTHELGHLQGLEHTCRASLSDGTLSCTVDQNGNRAELCSMVELDPTDPVNAAILQTTMVGTAAPMETIKRVPKSDDVAGIEAAYPLAQNPNVNTPPPYNVTAVGGGCSVGALGQQASQTAQTSGASGLAVVGMLAALGLWLGRRRRRLQPGVRRWRKAS